MKRPRKKRMFNGREHSLHANCGNGRRSHGRAAWTAGQVRFPGRSVKVVRERKRWCVYIAAVGRRGRQDA